MQHYHFHFRHYPRGRSNLASCLRGNQPFAAVVAPVVVAAAVVVGHTAGVLVVAVKVVVVVDDDSDVDADVARNAGMVVVTAMLVVVVVDVVGKQEVRAVAPSCSDTTKKVEGLEALEQHHWLQATCFALSLLVLALVAVVVVVVAAGGIDYDADGDGRLVSVPRAALLACVYV